MVLVRGNDTYTGVELAVESTWGTAATANWVRVAPILEETLFVEASAFAPSREWGGTTGALGAYDIGRQVVRGGFTVYPSYNAKFFHYLLGQVHGGMELAIPGAAPNGASVSNYGTHVYMPQPFVTAGTSGVGSGFTLRVWKMGPTNSSGQACDVYTGCVVTSMIWEQPQGERPKVTFTFIGKQDTPTYVGASGPFTTQGSAPTGNDAAANWTNPNNIHGSSDAVWATTGTLNAQLRLDGYTNFSAFPTEGTIDGFLVVVTGKKTDVGGTSTLQFDIQLSWDGGTTWTTAKTTSNLTASNAAYNLGSASDTWGRTWSMSEVRSSTLFKARIKAVGTVVGTPTWSADSVVVNAYVRASRPVDVQTGVVEIQMRDFKGLPSHATLPGICKVGQNTGAAHNFYDPDITGFRVTLDGHYDVAPAFLTALDSIEKPAHVDTWELSGEINSLLTQDYGTANRPRYMFANRQNGNFRVRYCSVNYTVGSTGVPFAFDMYLPCVTWTASEDFLNDINAPTVRWAFNTQVDKFGIQSGEWAIPALAAVQWMMQTGNASTTTIGFVTTTLGDDMATESVGPQTPVAAQTTSVPSTGVGDGDWEDIAEAYVDGFSEANTAVQAAIVTYGGFDFSAVPSDATITGIEVRADGSYDDSGGDGVLRFQIFVSWDGGSSYSALDSTYQLTTTEVTSYCGGVGGLWGREWTVAELSSSNFKVKVKAAGSAVADFPIWKLDYLTATVKYTYINDFA